MHPPSLLPAPIDMHLAQCYNECRKELPEKALVTLQFSGFQLRGRPAYIAAVEIVETPG